MAGTPADFNDRIIEEFRANGGAVGGMFEGKPLILVHNVGAKSGKEYVTPLTYLEDDGRYLIFASKRGAPQNPGWFHNLKANPETRVELGDEGFDVVAEEVTGDERDRLYGVQVEKQPHFGEYQEQTDRKIPVLALTPKR